MLRDVTQRAVIGVLEENEVPYQFHKQENLLTLTDMGSEIIFRSMDNPERLVGTNLAWFGCDELTFTQQQAFLRLQARLRHPQASELCGFGVWTPNGFDWVWEKFISQPGTDYEAIQARPAENRALPADFYDKLAASYDERFYRQEVLGEYLNIRSGRAYYAFDREHHVKPVAYSPRHQLVWTADFNVDPCSSLIGQIEDTTTREEMMLGRRSARLRVLDEIVLPDSNTPAVVRELFRRLDSMTSGQGGQIGVHVYGDPAGSARSSTHVASASDWAIIRQAFGEQRRYRMVDRVERSAPAVRDRVNAVNAMLCNAAGERRVVIDPRCKELVRDLEQVGWRQDASGNATGDIDKRDPARTHTSDALGYLIEAEWGIRQAAGPRSGYVA